MELKNQQSTQMEEKKTKKANQKELIGAQMGKAWAQIAPKP